MRERFLETKIVAQKNCSTTIQNPRTNKTAQYRIYAILRFYEGYKNKETENRKYCWSAADVEFDNTYEFFWQDHTIKIIHTLEHRLGSSKVLLNDCMEFFGDTMLNEDTFLKFDSGDESQFSEVMPPLLSTISPDMKIFPSHGASFIKKGWKKLNG